MRLVPAVRWRLALVAVVLAVAAGLLAMHQLSVGHAAVVPTELSVRAAAGHQAATLPAAAPRADHRAADAPRLVVAADHDHDAGHSGGCAGCGDHGLDVIGCLAAVGLLIIGRLLRPRHRPRSRPVTTRRRFVPVNLLLNGWRRPPLSLHELAISRT